jgi:hypothetical protein
MRTYVPILREQFGFLLGQIEKKLTENGDNKLDLQELYNNMTFDSEPTASLTSSLLI